MGCGCSSSSSAAAAAQEPRPRAQASNGVELAPGQTAIIRDCPNARLNGERVILQEYNCGLGEWTVKGDKFPLSVGMSLGAQFLEIVEEPSNGVELAPGQTAIIRNGPNARLNGERVILQEYNCGLGEWTVKGDKFPLSVGMSLGAQFLEIVEAAPTLLTSNSCERRKEHTCPSGHALQRHEAPNSDYSCDVCGKEVAEGETLWGCRLCDYDRCQQCANKGIVEFTDTDGDKVVLKDNNTLGIDCYVNGVLVNGESMIKLRVSDRTIALEGDSADKWAAATVPIGQEYILKQALNLFAEIQSRKGL